jgi:hypothetical protein
VAFYYLIAEVPNIVSVTFCRSNGSPKPTQIQWGYFKDLTSSWEENKKMYSYVRTPSTIMLSHFLGGKL